MDLEAKLQIVPHDPGVYIFRDEAGRALYVGKAGDLRKRLQQHWRGDSLGTWAEHMRDKARDIDYIVTRSETEALLLESNLIKQYKPPFNVRLMDDKSYPYLKFTDEMYPRLLVVRDLPAEAQVRIPGGRGRLRRGLHDPKRREVYRLGSGLVFGPYPNARVMWRMRDIISQCFGLRHCRRTLDGTPNGRPCLNYHIKRCVGPCTGQVSAEEYGKLVAQAVMLLEGRSDEVVRQFQERMQQAAEELEFERAAVFRDRIEAIRSASQDQLVNAAEERDQDVLGVAVDDDWATVDVFPVRQGRMLEPVHYHFTHVRGRTREEILEAGLTRHYGECSVPPRYVLLPETLGEAAEWEQMLSELRSDAEGRASRVELLVPRRGERRKLVELAERNAAVNLARLLEERSRRRHENMAAVRDLAEALELPDAPVRIECYDVSNLQGQEAVGSMVVFTDGLPDKRNYRRFKIRLSGQPNDYAMLAEMLTRRLQRGLEGHAKFLPLPDLIVMDGGKGQVSTAAKVLRELGLQHLALCGLAKREEEVFVPGRADPVDMRDHPRGWFLLQRIRDEAHRFAISYHHGLRSKTVTKSQLDQVPGIGPVRRAALFRAFPSIQAMTDASVEELAAVEGMNFSAARKLQQFLMAEGCADTETEMDAEGATASPAEGAGGPEQHEDDTDA
ncbi:MAG: excinuclease ABC subunit UvrC [Armatimonadetes bacterium]|nr:excinuclease ABC subunit UvrC [Armatimonadota bacterium]